MTQIYGYSDDLVEIEDSDYSDNEIDCFDSKVNISFEDGTKITCQYPKKLDNPTRTLGVWQIEVVNKGTAEQTLDICMDENALIYSDVFRISAEVSKVKVVSK